MLIAIAPAALLPLVVVIALSSFSMYRMLSEAALKYAEATATAQAAEIGADLGEKTAAVRALSYLFADYRAVPAPMRRDYFVAALRAVYRTQQEVIAAWTTWEPGALEDDPKPYEGTPLSTASGGFNATWTRGLRGTVLAPVDESVYEGIYYTTPKERLVPVLIPPYRFSYTGKAEDAVYETTISAPILFGGEFKGVVGFDIDVATYQRMVESIRIFETGYAAMVTDTGIRISHPRRDLVGTQIGDDLSPDRKAEFLRLIEYGQPFTFKKKARVSGVDSLVFGVPIQAGTATPHWVLLLVVPMAEVTENAVAAARSSAALGLAAALIVIVAILLVARGLSRPLISLTRNIESMARGGMPGLLELSGTDELLRLAGSFNALSVRLSDSMTDLHSANRDLAALNAELETKVAERTADLERTLTELRESQERMTKTEKFAVLGHLSAEIAHELNTPLAAVRSSADYIGRTGSDFWLKLMRFAATANAGDLEDFEKLLSCGLETTKDAAKQPAKRSEKKKFAAELLAAGIAVDDSLADDADALGAIPATAPLVSLLKAGNREAIRLAADIAQLSRAGTMVRFSADKAAATVSALVSYARTESHEAFEPIDVVKELEELLVLYYGATKRGVKIVKDFRCRKSVLGLRDKLNQVWVNLVNNALQAMEGSGELVLRTERLGDRIAISITDSGHGIPDDIRDKIFQPLFTTKRQGEGTGLGLDICKKIIERHNGEISFESVPGRTVFTVQLPIAGVGEVPSDS